MAPVDPSVIDALGRGRLGRLPARIQRRLAETGQLHELRAGETFRQQGDLISGPVLLIRGLMRLAMAAADGREITIGYLRPGQIRGLPALFIPARLPNSSRAVLPSRLFSLDAAVLREEALSDPTVCWTLAEGVAEVAGQWMIEIARQAFPGVRERLCRHLLDLATEAGGHLVAGVTHDDLASAVGSPREVVARELRKMRDERLLALHRGRVELLAPDDLADIAQRRLADGR